MAVGAISASGSIADFSSRGPTADGRIKPEVVARGEATYVAVYASPTAFGFASGTSFSCPLTAGSAAVLLSARQDWTPLQVREALMKTASRSATPDNTFGYGIVNLLAALDYLPLNSVVIDHKALKDTTNNLQPYISRSHRSGRAHAAPREAGHRAGLGRQLEPRTAAMIRDSAHYLLRHGGFRNQKRVGDLCSRQAPDGPAA